MGGGLIQRESVLDMRHGQGTLAAHLWPAVARTGAYPTTKSKSHPDWHDRGTLRGTIAARRTRKTG
jgi:hypothetical protein